MDISAREVIEKINIGGTVEFRELTIYGDLTLSYQSVDTVIRIKFFDCTFEGDINILSTNGACEITFKHCRMHKVFIDKSVISNLKLCDIFCHYFYARDSAITESLFDDVTVRYIRLSMTRIIRSNIDTIRCVEIYIDRCLFYKNIIDGMIMNYNDLNVIMNSTFNTCSMLGLRIRRMYIYKCDFDCGNNFYSIETEKVTVYESSIKESVHQLCPEEGAFIGYKSTDLYSPIGGERNWMKAIAVLEIPADAERVNGFNNKCRCSKAKVLRLEDLEGNILTNCTKLAYSPFMQNDKMINYIPGEMVYPDSFDDNVLVECSHGIHFFMHREEAIHY